MMENPWRAWRLVFALCIALGIGGGAMPLLWMLSIVLWVHCIRMTGKEW